MIASLNWLCVHGCRPFRVPARLAGVRRALARMIAVMAAAAWTRFATVVADGGTAVTCDRLTGGILLDGVSSGVIWLTVLW